MTETLHSSVMPRYDANHVLVPVITQPPLVRCTKCGSRGTSAQVKANPCKVYGDGGVR